MDSYSVLVVDWLPRARKSRISAYASMVTLRTQLGTTNAGRVAEPRNYSPRSSGFPKQIVSSEYDDRVVLCDLRRPPNSKPETIAALAQAYLLKDTRWW